MGCYLQAHRQVDNLLMAMKCLSLPKQAAAYIPLGKGAASCGMLMGPFIGVYQRSCVSAMAMTDLEDRQHFTTFHPIDFNAV